MLEEQVRILKLEEERKAQLDIIERLTQTQNSDIRKEAGNGWTRVRPNICTTEKCIQTQQQLQKSKVVPGSKTYAETLREGKKILMKNDSHIRRVKREKLQNSFDNAKSFARYFSGAKTDDLHHYIILSLLKEKPETAVIYIDSNNINHRIFEDFNADKEADEIIDIGKMCGQYGVKDVTFSSICVKNSIKLFKMITQVNGAVNKKCEENGFHFVSKGYILRKHLWEDGIHLTDEETNIFAEHIVDYIRDIILKEF